MFLLLHPYAYLHLNGKARYADLTCSVSVFKIQLIILISFFLITAAMRQRGGQNNTTSASVFKSTSACLVSRELKKLVRARSQLLIAPLLLIAEE